MNSPQQQPREKAVKPARFDFIPEPAQSIAQERRFSRDEYALLQLGLVPHEMEDKWFVYFDAARHELLFHRSWTGYCIFRVLLAETPDGGCYVAGAWANPDPEQFRSPNPENSAQLLAPLFDLLLVP